MRGVRPVLLAALVTTMLVGCTRGVPATPTLGGGAPADAASALVQEVLDLAGTRPGLAPLAKALRTVVAGLSAADAFGDGPLVRRVLDQDITEARLYERMAAHFRDRYDAERLRRAHAMLREPLVRRMTALEVEAATVDDDAITAWATSHAGTDDGRRRLDLARRIDVATGATEATLDVLLGAGRGVIAALGDRPTRESQHALDVLRDDVARAEADTRHHTVRALAFAYRGATPDEVARYAAVLESDIGRWFSGMQREAGTRASETVARDAMRHVLEIRRAPKV